MSNIDLNKLKKLAIAATPGEWQFRPTTPFMDAEIASENNVRVVNLLAGDVSKANSEFIAAVSPSTIIAIIEQLEAAQRSNSAQDDHINQQQNRIDSLEKTNAELGKELCKAQAELARRDALEPVAYWRKYFRANGSCHADGINEKKYHLQNPPHAIDGGTYEVTPLYTAAPAAVLPEKLVYGNENCLGCTEEFIAGYNHRIEDDKSLGCQPVKEVVLPKEAYFEDDECPEIIKAYIAKDLISALDAAGVKWREAE